MEKISHKCYGISSYASNCMLSNNPRSGIYEAKTSRTLDRQCGNPCCNQGGVVIVEILKGQNNGKVVQAGDQ